MLASVQKKVLKMLAFFLLSKLVKSSFGLRQMFVKGLLIEATPIVFRDFHNSFGLPMFSVNLFIKKFIFFVLLISGYYISTQYKNYSLSEDLIF